MQFLFRSNAFIYHVTILMRIVIVTEVNSKARRSGDCYYLMWLLSDFILRISVVICLTAITSLHTKWFYLVQILGANSISDLNWRLKMEWMKLVFSGILSIKCGYFCKEISLSEALYYENECSKLILIPSMSFF